MFSYAGANLYRVFGEDWYQIWKKMMAGQLMQMGMLTRTPRGRCVTRLAYEHLHMAVPKRFDDEDSGQTSMF